MCVPCPAKRLRRIKRLEPADRTAWPPKVWIVGQHGGDSVQRKCPGEDPHSTAPNRQGLSGRGCTSVYKIERFRAFKGGVSRE